MKVEVKIRLSDADWFTLDDSESGYLKDFKLLMELDSDITTILAPTSANELNLTVVNTAGLFTASNKDSELYGKIKDGTELNLYVNNVKKGVFYVTDYSAPTSCLSATATIRAVDRLQNLLNSVVSTQQVHNNVTLSAYIKKIFVELDVPETDLLIDESLNAISLDFTVVNGKKLSEILSDIMISGYCYCYVNDENKICFVSRKRQSSSYIHTFNGSNIISVTIPQSMLTSYNFLTIGYTKVSLSAVKEVLSISDYKLTNGENVIANFEVLDGNLYEIDSVKLESLKKATITGLEHSQSDVSLTVQYDGETSEKVNISVYGKSVITKNATVSKKNEESIATVGEKHTEISSSLIQTKARAKEVLEELWSTVTLEIPYLQLKTKCDDFTYDILDAVEVVEPTRTKLDYKGYIHTLLYTWSGGDALDCEVSIRALAKDESEVS